MKTEKSSAKPVVDWSVVVECAELLDQASDKAKAQGWVGVTKRIDSIYNEIEKRLSKHENAGAKKAERAKAMAAKKAERLRKQLAELEEKLT